MSKKTENIIMEAGLWAFAAWTLPFIALGGLFFLKMIGWEDFYNKAFVIGSTIFFGIAVFWWWWAISKVSQLAKMNLKIQDEFQKIQKEIKNIKKDFNK